MSYAQLDDGWYDHPHFLELSLDALGLWSVGTTYCSKHLTDGKIPSSLVRRWGRKGTAAATELVREGRWRKLESGDYEHVGYLDHNPSKSDVLARKEAQRLAKSDAGKKGGMSSGRSRREAAASPPASSTIEKSASTGVEGAGEALSSPLLSTPIDLPPSPPLGGMRLVEIPAGQSRNSNGVPPSPPEPKAEEPPTREQEYQRAYEAGVVRAKGGGYAMPEPQRGALHQAILAHARWGQGQDEHPPGTSIRGADLLEWLDASAEDFARWLLTQAERDPKAVTYYSSFGPKGMLKWLNEDSMRREARRVG